MKIGIKSIDVIDNENDVITYEYKENYYEVPCEDFFNYLRENAEDWQDVEDLLNFKPIYEWSEDYLDAKFQTLEELIDKSVKLDK